MSIWDEIKKNPLLTAIVVLAFLLITSFALAPTYRGNHLDATKAGEFGDFVGGYFGPILSLVGIFFVVLTLREQRETTIVERKDDKVQAFENRYYQLLHLHRENVAEMRVGLGVGEITGRKVFVSIMNELHVALGVIETIVKNEQLSWPFIDVLQLAYYCVFFGVGLKSSPSLREALKASGQKIDARVLDMVEDELEREGDASYSGYPYTYFQGHQTRLGHYYRHLYQLIHFVDDQPIDEEKMSYVKTVRAQLSNYEQALLLVNSLTGVGWEWWNNNFVLRYGMVKNIPRGFVEAYCFLRVEDLFPSDYFEWQQSTVKPSILESVKKA